MRSRPRPAPWPARSAPTRRPWARPSPSAATSWSPAALVSYCVPFLSLREVAPLSGLLGAPRGLRPSPSLCLALPANNSPSPSFSPHCPCPCPFLRQPPGAVGPAPRGHHGQQDGEGVRPVPHHAQQERGCGSGGNGGRWAASLRCGCCAPFLSHLPVPRNSVAFRLVPLLFPPCSSPRAVVGDVSALTPGGVRIGAPAMTSRGLKEAGAWPSGRRRW